MRNKKLLNYSINNDGIVKFHNATIWITIIIVKSSTCVATKDSTNREYRMLL